MNVLGVGAYSDDQCALSDESGNVSENTGNELYRKIIGQYQLSIMMNMYDDDQVFPQAGDAFNGPPNEPYSYVTKGPGKGGTIAIIIENFDPSKQSGSSSVLWYIGGGDLDAKNDDGNCAFMACVLNGSTKQVEFHIGFEENMTTKRIIEYGNIWDLGKKDWLISISWRAGPFDGGDSFGIKEIGAQCIIKYRLNDSDEEWSDFAYYYGGEDSSVSVINQVCSTTTSPSLIGKTKTGVPEAFGESGKGLFIGGDANGNFIIAELLR